MEQTEIWVRSSLDGTMQPSLLYRSASREKRPLLVGLHTWSHDRFNQVSKLVPVAEKLDFNLLLPEFRGSNLCSNPIRTQACGSEYAKTDIKDAIDYVLEHEYVDAENVFLQGESGGGHMALLMAGMIPEYFKAIGAFVPITDLRKWVKETVEYRPHILACCGENEEEMFRRSPVAYIDIIAKANLKIFHGKYDPTVPVSQSLELYAALMEKYPRCRVFLDIFDGGHQTDMDLAIHWLLSQYQKKELTKVTG